MFFSGLFLVLGLGWGDEIGEGVVLELRGWGVVTDIV